MPLEPKTLIGVFASHDSEEKNEALASLFEHCASDEKMISTLSKFRLVFTGGTYRRLFLGETIGPPRNTPPRYKLSEPARHCLQERCGVIHLPRTENGGITILASLLPQRKMSIMWPFLTPLTTHLYTPENQALFRLGDLWRAKRLMNTGSVIEWVKTEAERDSKLNVQKMPLEFELRGSGFVRQVTPDAGLQDSHYLNHEPEKFPDFREATLTGDWSQVTVALISHDEMKGKMVDFVTDYERDLLRFKKILTTNTTGRIVQEVAPALAGEDKVHRYHSGPKGGDIEIATEILFGRCHVVIFFVDPLHPHPHADDIRVVFGACMIHDNVRMLSNELQARYWMDRVVRENSAPNTGPQADGSATA